MIMPRVSPRPALPDPAPRPAIPGLFADLTDGLLCCLPAADVARLRLLSAAWRDWVTTDRVYWRRARNNPAYWPANNVRNLDVAPRIVQDELGFPLELRNVTRRVDAVSGGRRWLRFRCPVTLNDEAALIAVLASFEHDADFLCGIDLYDVRPELLADPRLLRVAAQRPGMQWHLAGMPPPALLNVQGCLMTFCNVTVTLEAARYFAAHRGSAWFGGFKNAVLDAGALPLFDPFNMDGRLEFDSMSIGVDLLREAAACADHVYFRNCTFNAARADVERALAPLCMSPCGRHAVRVPSPV